MNKELEKIKAKFYIKDGKVMLDHFGVFNSGLTSDEVKDYVKLRANTTDAKKLKIVWKKLENLSMGSTCPVATVDGKQYGLYYRHDIQHYCDVIFNKAKFVWD